MAQSNVRQTPGAACKIAIMRTSAKLHCYACLPGDSMLLILIDQIVVGWSGRSGPIMARSNIRPTPKASCKIAALSLCVAIANLCDLWVKLVPTVEIISPEVCGPHTSLSPWYALNCPPETNLLKFFIQTLGRFEFRVTKAWSSCFLVSKTPP